ncbi:MAG: mechanosensitive ion channel family protein [Thermomicrobiales bacterium]
MRSRLESQFSGALESLTSLAIRLVEAIVVIIIARYLHRFVRDRLLQRLDSPTLSESGRTVISVLATVVFGMATASVLLAIWGVTWSGIITAISLGTLGILLGVQDVLKSLIGGIFLILERPYSIGDRISVRDVTGRVIGIELRTTIIRSDDGHRIVAPNSIVFTDTMTNYSLRRQIRTRLILSGISGNAAELRTRIEHAVAGVDGVDGSVEVRIRPRGSKVRTPIREGLVGSHTEGQTGSRGTEVWVSWLGGGEPEVQEAVVALMRQLYPDATVHARNVKGAVVPQRSRMGHLGVR